VQAIDTNVVVRLIVHDDEEQGRRAEAIFRRALNAGGVWIAQVVLVETVWVLRSAYRFDRTSISSVLRTLLGTEGVTVDGELLVLSGLAAFEAGAADFADYLILETARRAQALPLWTFDERLVQTEGVERVP
jgi:predicted nucleic-acid-binding protein